MHDNGHIPPMTPDDLAALMAVAGPMYQESRLIESFTSDNPIPNTYDNNYGSGAIKTGLERAQHLAQASMHRQQQQMYVPPAPPIYTAPPTDFSYQQTIPMVPPVPMPTGNQMEFNFNPAAQDATNELLREISKKLTRVINLLEKGEGSATISKSNPKPNVKNQV